MDSKETFSEVSGVLKNQISFSQKDIFVIVRSTVASHDVRQYINNIRSCNLPLN